MVSERDFGAASPAWTGGRTGREGGNLFRRLRQCRLAPVDARFDLAAEVADEALHGPSRGVAQGADGVALHPGRDVPQKVDLALLGLAPLHALEHAPHPPRALAAGRA